MARDRIGLRAWLRPPRNILVLFVLIVCLPAAALVWLGFRLLDQDRELAGQRQIELLDSAADKSVRILEQDIAEARKQLENSVCPVAEVPDNAVCVVFRPELILVHPAGVVPYFPVSQKLREATSEPFETLESFEFRQPDSPRALEISLELANSSDPAIRAGALLRRGRILRKSGRINDAFAAYGELGRISSVSINGEPADLFARRVRCAILEAQSRFDELKREAEQLATDLRSGKWQLDRETTLHAQHGVDGWLHKPTGSEFTAEQESFAAALDWAYRRWAEKRTAVAAGVHAVDGAEGPTTILWSFAESEDRALIAGPGYVNKHWLAGVGKAVHPVRVHIGDASTHLDTPKVQRNALETGLPWTIVVTPGEGPVEPPEFAARRRNLAAGLAALLLLISAGSYFVWRTVNRELAVARLQSDFVSAVSHEFRTPLTALRQFNELLADGDEPPREKRRSFYQAQARATERLHRLVESLLDFGRMEAGRRPYKFEPLDAAVLARNVTDEFSREADSRGFDVTYDTDTGPHPVSADPDALSRALWNLLDNAVKYSGDSRNVELKVSRNNGCVAIAVRDYGIGIPSSERKTVFQKFVRGTASTSGGIRGTGLGLAMVRHIVEAHSGTVDLKSDEGKGSTFTIVLPARS